MTTTEPATAVFRAATEADVEALTGLERDANLVALAHVFSGVAFPEDDVRARWRQLLADPGVTVEVVGTSERLDVYLAYDDVRLRHLGVRPERWGEGLARAAVERAGGTRRLWVLADNHRARGLYDHLGWEPTGHSQPAEWPPHPTEQEYAR